MTGPTTLKLGYTDPRTDTFGAHPALGGPLDLNDGVTFTLVSPDGLELGAPPRTLVPTGNIRTQGERVVRAVYRHNREAVVRLIVGPSGTYAAFAATLRTLVAWVQAAPSQPITIQWQPPSATAPVYLDVVGGACDVSVDEGEWLRQQLEPVELVFVVRPGLRGDRVVLSNLVTNPGFEQGAGGSGTLVFGDTLANANAYTVLAGAAPTVAANVLTLASGTRVWFGSPGWGAVSQWQVRWQWQTGLVAFFYLHLFDINNWLGVSVTGTQLQLIQTIGGTQHVLASVGSLGLVAGNWYWLRLTQFPQPGQPAPSNDPAAVQAALYLDTGPGSVGAQVQTTAGPVPTFDTVTALAGKCALQASGAVLAVGGNFAGVQQVALFGPGGWSFAGMVGGATGAAAGAWEQNLANVLRVAQGAPVNGYGAGRIDFPPGGTVNASWGQYNGGTGPGGTVAGTNAMPTTSGATLHAGVWLRSSGLSASAQIAVFVREFDAGGNFLRQTAVALVTGNQAGWVLVGGSVATGANTAYADLLLNAVDTSGAGASANAIVWFDNAQVWDQTKTGMASMPYCELRFGQSPCQLLLTGLLGDLAAPCLVEWGTYQASWARGSALTYALGRRGVVSAGAQLVGQAAGYYGTLFTPQGIPVLDPTAFGGWYVKASSANGATWNPRGFSQAVSDSAGVYHLFARFKTADPTPAGVQVRARTDEALDPWFGDAQGLGTLGTYWGPWQNPLSSNGWTICDVGQVQLPPFPTGALGDPTALYVVPRGEWNPASGTPVEMDANWLALVPVDGSVVLGVVNNPANSPVAAVTNQYVWVYVDGLLVNRAGSGLGGPGVGMGLDGASAGYSLEASAVPNAAHAGGGGGTQGTGAINVNGGGDPYVVVDPALLLPGQQAGSGGINQLLGSVSDSAGDVLGMAVEVAYSPLYLWPR